MNTTGQQAKIAALSRLLAWVLLLLTALITIKQISDWYRFADWPWSIEESLLFVPAVMWGMYVFGYAALTGKPPRWMADLERNYDETFQGPTGPATRLARTFTFRLLSITCLTLLLILGDSFSLFGENIRGFVLLVEALCVFAAVVLIWRKYRSRSNWGCNNRG